MGKFKRVDALKPDEFAAFTRTLSTYSPPVEPTGEVIEESGDSSKISRVIITGAWTPYGCMRDCGDHYIIARYSRYDQVSMDLQTIIEDTEDY